MFWKRENENEKKLKQINEILKKSFANVKRDTSNIFQWLNYFHRKNIEQSQIIERLQLELSYMPKTREEIRRIMDDYYSFESILSRIRELDHKLNELTAKQARVEYPQQQIVREEPTELNIELNNIEKRLEKLEQKKLSVKEKIMKRLTRNSKEYVKGIIISYIKKYGKISAMQLKEIVVDEQNFCSKSSFYRLLEEIEQSEEIGVIKKGKENLYISKVLRQI